MEIMALLVLRKVDGSGEHSEEKEQEPYHDSQKCSWEKLFSGLQKREKVENERYSQQDKNDPYRWFCVEPGEDTQEQDEGEPNDW